MLNSHPIIKEILSPQNLIDEEELIDWSNDDNDYNNEIKEEVNNKEIFEMIRYLNDPEHPLTLEQLNVLSLENISINNNTNKVLILFTPTIPHCSMATLIGLCIRVKLLRSLSSRYKVIIKISPGTHTSEESINKQLNDKERVAAALENIYLLDAVNKCITNTDR